METQFSPILDRILVEDISTTTMFDSMGNVIPDQFQKRSNEGRVVSAGEAVYIGGVTLPMPVTVGDTVIFGEYGPERVTVEGKEYLLIRVHDVKAVKRA